MMAVEAGGVSEQAILYIHFYGVVGFQDVDSFANLPLPEPATQPIGNL